MSTSHHDAWLHFFRIGMQYYIAGRAAALGRQIQVTGNLLHHAVEMLLKGDLSRTFTLDEIRKKFGHRLEETWKAFKGLHSSEDLSGFNQLIMDLDRFERIRYPDEYIKHGAVMVVGWGSLKPPVSQLIGPKVPEYCLYVNEVDALIARLFVVCRINPEAYWGSLHPEAKRFLEYENAHCKDWLPAR